jgi:hypothetical protein
MNELSHKYKIGKFIFFSNLSLFGILFILYILKGFTNDEFLDLMKLLAPIKAVYMTALIKFVVANRNISDNEIKKSRKQVSSLYKTVTSIMIYSHITSLITIVTLFALFRIFDFASLKNLIVLIEIFFGAYIGLIMTDMFKTEEKEEKQDIANS